LAAPAAAAVELDAAIDDSKVVLDCPRDGAPLSRPVLPHCPVPLALAAAWSPELVPDGVGLQVRLGKTITRKSAPQNFEIVLIAKSSP
jgi:hypothetical protein